MSRRPFFGIFNSVLVIAQALRLLQLPAPTLAVANGVSPEGTAERHEACKLEGLLEELLLGKGRGGVVPRPGQELLVLGNRFVRPVDEHMSLNDVVLMPLLVRDWESPRDRTL